MSVCPNGHSSASSDYCDVCGAPIEAAAAAPAASTTPVATPTEGGNASGPITCPNCSFTNLPDALFCENCGYDFTTGSLPEPEPAPLQPPTTATPSAIVTPGPAAAESPVEQGEGEPAAGATEAGTGAIATAATGTPTGPRASGGGQPDPVAPPIEGDAWVAEIWIDPEWYAEQNSDEPLPSGGPPDIVVLRQSSLLVGRASVSRDIHPQIDCGTDSGVSRRQCQLNTDGQRWWVEDLQSSNGTFVGAAGAPLPTTPITPGQRKEISDGDRIFVGAWTRLVIRKALPGEV